jgi:Zn-dependent peptidase ImmA (M78 family)
MASVKGLNPALLIWARERAGQDIGAVAMSLKKDVSVIEAWESGVAAPTYVQLEKLAYEVYKRPIAIFFFPFPPEEPDAGESFRTLPEIELEKLEADTLFKVRKARALQESLAEINNARNPALRRIFADIKLSASDTVKSVAADVREYLGIELDEQKTWKSPVEAFKLWRSAIENSGIFVFKDSFKQAGVSGFCLVDREFPIIYVNNSTPATRQVFTLLHELAHILLDNNGVTNVDDSFVALLKGAERQIEVFCNAFAAEFLVPDEDFRAVSRGMRVEDVELVDLARIYSVSREVILRRCRSGES